MHELIFYIKEFGYIGLFAVIFFECFPFAFFLPGDSLIFTTGFLASIGYFKLGFLIGTFFVAGLVGYMFSFWFGHAIVKKLFTNESSKIFNPKYIRYTHQFFEKYGAKTLIIGRFVPVVRSFAPSLAGLADLSFKKFLLYNLIGVVLWATIVTLLGFYLGHIVPHAENYLTPIVIVIIIFSLIPSIYDYLDARSIKIDGK